LSSNFTIFEAAYIIQIMISPQILSALEAITGAPYIFADEVTRNHYGHDETEDYNFPPTVVVKPGTPEEISEIMKLANQHRIPVVPMGARTGLSGGALSIYGGIGLSMERFTAIEIDEKNLQGIVEPAVITQVFREAAADCGLFYPPDPSSRQCCGK
jgi:glycolate oxidase